MTQSTTDHIRVFIIATLWKEIIDANPEFPIDKVIPVTKYMVDHPDWFYLFWEMFNEYNDGDLVKEYAELEKIMKPIEAQEQLQASNS